MPGSNQIQKQWLKAFPAACRYITKKFNTIMEESERINDWLNTRINYLPPKSGHSKGVRIYQLIMCFTIT